jgi:acetylornithine deacetylase
MSDLNDLLARLVEIDSVNPELVKGGAGEGQIARFVAEWLERAGLDVELQEVRPGRPNVLATRRGTGGGRTLLLNAHMDTVEVAGMEDPHRAIVKGDRMYGRGTYDMKAGLAAAMVAAAQSKGLAGDVVVAAVIDEEAGALGTRALVDSGVRPDAAIVTEPTELEVAIAHKGFVGFRIGTAGRAAHGSRPDEGIDAILKMAPVLAGLSALNAELQAREPHPLLGAASLHASVIEGGQEFSSYPERCIVTGEVRTLPGQTADAVEQELKAAIDGSGEAPSLGIELVGEPFEVAADAELVRVVGNHADAPVIGVPFWADSSLLAAAGIPTLLYGPHGEGAHAVVEWVDLRSVERVREVLVATAAEFCAAT